MEYYPDTLNNLGYTNIFNEINLSNFILSIPNHVWSIFYIIFLVAFLIYSTTLLYHWHRYRAYSPTIVVARFIYIGGTICSYISRDLFLSTIFIEYENFRHRGKSIKYL